MRPNARLQRIIRASKVAAGFGGRGSTKDGDETDAGVDGSREEGESFERPLLSLHVRQTVSRQLPLQPYPLNMSVWTVFFCVHRWFRCATATRAARSKCATRSANVNPWPRTWSEPSCRWQRSRLQRGVGHRSNRAPIVLMQFISCSLLARHFRSVFLFHTHTHISLSLSLSHLPISLT